MLLEALLGHRIKGMLEHIPQITIDARSSKIAKEGGIAKGEVSFRGTAVEQFCLSLQHPPIAFFFLMQPSHQFGAVDAKAQLFAQLADQFDLVTCPRSRRRAVVAQE